MKNYIFSLVFVVFLSNFLFSSNKKVVYLTISDFFKLPISDIEQSNFHKLLIKKDYKKYLFLAKEKKDSFLRNALFLYFIYYNIEEGNFEEGVESIKSVNNEDLQNYLLYKIFSSSKKDIRTFTFLSENNFISKKYGDILFKWIKKLIKDKDLKDAEFILKSSENFIDEEDVNYLKCFLKFKMGKNITTELINFIKYFNERNFSLYFYLVNV